MVSDSPSPSLTEAERQRRALLAIRQAFYSAADELGRLYDLERPCRECERRRRETGQRTAQARRDDRAA